MLTIRFSLTPRTTGSGTKIEEEQSNTRFSLGYNFFPQLRGYIYTYFFSVFQLVFFGKTKQFVFALPVKTETLKLWVVNKKS